MEQIRSFMRWMMIDPSQPELAQAQYDQLKFQIPSLYALLMVNAVAVAYTHFDVAPAYLTLGVLIPMLVLTTIRCIIWLRQRNRTPGPQEAITAMRRTVLFGSLVAALYVAWALSLDSFGGPAERGHVALFIAITFIGCIFCLMHLPQAALMVMLIVTVPSLIHFLARNEDVYSAMALNILLVCLVILQVLFSGYHGFRKLIRSQADLAAKQAETLCLSADNARMARTDALTGLPNRRHLFSRLKALIEEGETTGRRFAVGVIDLDRFKPINDTYGHQLGDQLLVEVGTRLKALALPQVECCRLGGDEFGFLCQGSEAEAAEAGARICRELSRPYRIGGLRMSIGASCGVAGFPAAGTSAHALFDRADYALYHSKSTRRGETTVYSEDHEARIRSERAIEIALQTADIASEFQVYFQSVVSLPERVIVGFEALARWNNPTLGKVPPDAFVPVAERTGQIHRLTVALFGKAVDQITALPDDLTLSFNLSAHDVTSHETVLALLDVIGERRIDPGRIMFEITETSVIDSYERAEHCLGLLREAGVKLALDDFGTGYSSLSYLHRLPIDCVKIDRSFVEGIADPIACGVVTSILDLCRSMGLQCVVEGVEELRQLDLLESMQCRLVQGHHFGLPKPFETILSEAGAGRGVAGLPLSAPGAGAPAHGGA